MMEEQHNIDQILGNLAQNIGWKNFQIIGDVNCEKGNGAISEFFIVSLLNKDNGEKLDFAVKKALKGKTRRDELRIRDAFENEIIFYKNIVPTLLKFKDGKATEETFDFFPKFYISDHTDEEEYIIMENLRTQSYDTIPRDQFFNAEQMEFILKCYAKYHALSFAFKDQHPEEYQKLVGKLWDFSEVLKNNQGMINSLIDACQSGFKHVNEKIRKDCQEYIENPKDLYVKSSTYTGKYTCLLHGDCWSNNIMLKLKNSKVQDMKFIDFQGISDGSPIQDLTYFIYAGSLFDVFGDIQKYLQIYYEKFSKVCRDLGSNPDVLYPQTVFLEEWKEYAKRGVFMGLIANKFKLIKREEIEEMTGEGEQFMDQVTKLSLGDEDQKLYEKRVKELIEDIYQKEYIP